MKHNIIIFLSIFMYGIATISAQELNRDSIPPAICTGISFVDSTPLRVCRNQRILIHKTFEGLAQRGKCSMR